MKHELVENLNQNPKKINKIQKRSQRETKTQLIGLTRRQLRHDQNSYL